MTVAIQAFTHATVTTSGQSTLSLPSPSGITVGDMLVIIQAANYGASGVTPTTPTGWTAITGGADNNQLNQLWGWYKIATSADIGLAVTIGTGGYRNWSGAYFDITGAATTMPVAAVNDATSGTPTEPNITCPASGSLILWACCQALGYGVTGLAGTTLEFLNSAICGLLVAYNSGQSDTVTGPAANSGSYHWSCLALAMGPAGGGSPSGSGAVTLGGLTVSGSATASGVASSSGSGAVTLGGLTVAGWAQATNPAYTYYDLRNVAIANKYIQLEGGAQYSLSYGPGNSGAWYAVYGQPGMYNSAIRFVGSVSEIHLYMAPYITTGGTNYVRLFIDNVSWAVTAYVGSGTAFSWFTLATGLDTTAQHTYTIVWSQTMCIQQLSTVGSISTTYLPARKIIGLYGDSILYAGNNYDATSAIAEPIRQCTGRQIFSAPVGDTGVVYNNGSGTALSLAPLWSTYGVTPAMLIVEFGLLDVTQGSNLTTFQSAYVSMIQALQTALPTTIILCEAISKYSTDTDSNMVPYNAAIQAAVAAVASPLVYYRQGSFNNYQPAEGGGMHPNAVGYAQMGLAYGMDAAAILGPPNAGGRRKMGVMS